MAHRATADETRAHQRQAQSERPRHAPFAKSLVARRAKTATRPHTPAQACDPFAALRAEIWPIHLPENLQRRAKARRCYCCCRGGELFARAAKKSAAFASLLRREERRLPSAAALGVGCLSERIICRSAGRSARYFCANGSLAFVSRTAECCTYKTNVL